MTFKSHQKNACSVWGCRSGCVFWQAYRIRMILVEGIARGGEQIARGGELTVYSGPEAACCSSSNRKKQIFAGHVVVYPYPNLSA